jgi:pyruvate dehydrogenase E1 component alpha subunit
MSVGTQSDNGQAPAEAASPKEGLRELYARMVLIRCFEEETERQYKKARIGGYCHLAIGQEAATVGTVAPLREEDLMVTSYRTHGLALARGAEPKAVMAELFGRSPGSARGRGGSMHLLDVERGFLGGWGIVAGHLPIAVGVALAIARRDEPRAVLCELGDGAVNLGAWHESLNLAAIWELPIVFVIFNNQYGMGTSIEQAAAEPELFRRAAAFKMHGERVDGQRLEEVLDAAGRLFSQARDERRPSVLELSTYRFRGHSVADAGTAYRSEEELESWKRRDPIEVLGEELSKRGEVKEEELERIASDAVTEIEEAVAFAEDAPEPPLDALGEFVYGDPATTEQFSRMVPGSPFGESELILPGGGSS